MAPSTTSRALGHFVSGGADGDIKVWDLQMMLASNDKLDTLAPTSHGDACVQHLADCHEKSTQTLGATYGVLDLVSTRSALLTTPNTLSSLKLAKTSFCLMKRSTRSSDSCALCSLEASLLYVSDKVLYKFTRAADKELICVVMSWISVSENVLDFPKATFSALCVSAL
jgi:hypothetical protein